MLTSLHILRKIKGGGNGLIKRQRGRALKQTYNWDGLLQTSVGIVVSFPQMQVHLLLDSWGFNLFYVHFK